MRIQTTHTRRSSSSPPRLIVTLALTLAGAGCTTTPAIPDLAKARIQLQPEDRPARKAVLPPGTRVRLLPIAVSLAGSTTLPTGFADGLWRVAMRQTARFDIAAGVDDIASPARVSVHFDGGSNTFTAALERAGEPPVALAAVRDPAIPSALDRLAFLTRSALGEEIAMQPIRCDVAYSADRNCVKFTERGLQRRRAGDARAALRFFERARSYDGGCALTLLHLATEVSRLSGDANANRAASIAAEALSYRLRLTPHTEHRLARVTLEIREDDPTLLKLGRAYESDRPHDPHGRYTTALALEKQGKHAEALPLLQSLRRRWPGNAPVRYQLCFALLGTGDGEGALEVLDEAKRQLTGGAIARPYAMALYHSGKHEELRRYLTALRRTRGIAGTTAEREILRMEASHAILVGDRDRAIQKLAESLAWVQRRFATLDRYALDIAEDGEVLARLNAPRVLSQAIDGFQQLGQLPPSVANALTYLGGLLSVSANQTPTRALHTLDKSADTVWHSQLEAALHHRRGELDAETRALERAVRSSKSPLLQASVARALEAAGNKPGSAKVAAYVRKQLLAFDQRRPHEHPLMTPGRAMAFVATK
jgi:Tetratricopeptide repeat